VQAYCDSICCPALWLQWVDSPGGCDGDAVVTRNVLNVVATKQGLCIWVLEAEV
jgi:hypothetical protein